MMQYSEDILEDIRRTLLADTVFDFRRSGNTLQQGVCPNCGKRECWISLDKPFKVQCNRHNKCGWSATPRVLYPDLFSDLSQRYPATDANPNAAAEAYLRENRGFDLAKLKGMFRQGFTHPEGASRYYPCVEIPIEVPQTLSLKGTLFKRLIDASDVREVEKLGEKKAKIIGKYMGYGWVPPRMKFCENDEIWITEGIFKAMAFLMIGKKAISALSSNNFPREIIKAHQGKQIRWIIALDADKAGQEKAIDHLEELQAMKETGFVAFPPKAGQDWDDLYRLGRLTDKLLQESIARGFRTYAATPEEYAFFYHCQYQSYYMIFPHENALYRCIVDKPGENQPKVNYPVSGNYAVAPDIIRQNMQTFHDLCAVEKLCNCYPDAVYTEYDPLTRKRVSAFYVRFPDGRRKPRIMEVDGQFLRSADTFNTELLKTTVFVAFSGNNKDMEYLRNRWDQSGRKEVKTIDYIGYDHETQIYAFDNFAYCHGVMTELNDFGYFEYGENCIKTRKTDFPLMPPKDVKEFNGDFFPDFYRVFSDNGVILLAWWTGNFFAEQIRKNHASWCFFEYTGERGAGKSTLLRLMWKLTGLIKDYEGRNPKKGTDTSFFRELASFGNLPTIILEADDFLGDRGKAQMFNFTSLKEFYNFGAVTRSIGVKTCGTETKQELYRGGVLITQNKPVQGDQEGALISRFVSCHCTKDHFTPDSRVLAEKFERMTVTQLGGYLHLVLSKEAELLDAYPGLYVKAHAELCEYAAKSGKIKDDRIIKCHAQVAAWVRLLPKLFPRMTPEITEQVIDRLWYRAEMQQRRLNDEDPVMEEFWNIYDFINFQISDGKPVELLNHSKNPDYIAINLPDFIRKAVEARQQIPDAAVLKSKFPSSYRHKFVDYKPVYSNVLGKTLKCWLFQKAETGE